VTMMRLIYSHDYSTKWMNFNYSSLYAVRI